MWSAGPFNPPIFHPSWFAQQGLLRPEEAHRAEQTATGHGDEFTVTPEAALFSTEWLQLKVTRDRLYFATARPDFHEELRDLLLGTLRTLGPLPLRALGINRDFHYLLESEEQVQAITGRLAPKEDWAQILGVQPSLINLTIQGDRPDKWPGYIAVTVQPSDEVVHGLVVKTNDHYVLQQADDGPRIISQVIAILSYHWSQAMQHAQSIALHIAQLAQLEQEN